MNTKKEINSKLVEQTEESASTKTVEKTTPIKEWLVEYIGEQHNPENEQVTVEMIVNTMADEFPEFLMVVAEENWIRGYHQALTDVEEVQKAYDKAAEETQQENGPLN